MTTCSDGSTDRRLRPVFTDLSTVPCGWPAIDADDVRGFLVAVEGLQSFVTRPTAPPVPPLLVLPEFKGCILIALVCMPVMAREEADVMTGELRHDRTKGPSAPA